MEGHTSPIASVKPNSEPRIASPVTGGHRVPTAARRRCPTPTGPSRQASTRGGHADPENPQTKPDTPTGLAPALPVRPRPEQRTRWPARQPTRHRGMGLRHRRQPRRAAALTQPKRAAIGAATDRTPRATHPDLSKPAPPAGLALLDPQPSRRPNPDRPAVATHRHRDHRSRRTRPARRPVRGAVDRHPPRRQPHPHRRHPRPSRPLRRLGMERLPPRPGPLPHPGTAPRTPARRTPPRHTTPPHRRRTQQGHPPRPRRGAPPPPATPGPGRRRPRGRRAGLPQPATRQRRARATPHRHRQTRPAQRVRRRAPRRPQRRRRHNLVRRRAPGRRPDPALTPPPLADAMTGDRDSRVPPPRVGRDRRDLSPTGFCAQAALDTARNLNTLANKAENHALGSLQAELFHARVALNQLRTDLTLARADARTSPKDLDNAVARAVQAVANVDNVITHIHRQLGTRTWPHPELECNARRRLS